jgi:hypothetical protein
MYGPGPIQPLPPGFPPGFPPGSPPTARRSRAARVGLFLLRTLLVLVPLVTLGILAWVPLLRIAAVRRRPWDWVLLLATAAACTAAFVLQGVSPDLDAWQANTGMGVLLSLAAACPIYFLFTELRPPAPVLAPWPPQYGAPFGPPFRPVWTAPVPQPPVPLVPLGQVQAELDELGVLLREQHRPS